MLLSVVDSLCDTFHQASAHILGQEKRGRTRSQTRKGSESDEKKPAVKRTSTMAQTAKVRGSGIIARLPGREGRGRLPG